MDIIFYILFLAVFTLLAVAIAAPKKILLLKRRIFGEGSENTVSEKNLPDDSWIRSLYCVAIAFSIPFTWVSLIAFDAPGSKNDPFAIFVFWMSVTSFPLSIAGFLLGVRKRIFYLLGLFPLTLAVFLILSLILWVPIVLLISSWPF